MSSRDPNPSQVIMDTPCLRSLGDESCGCLSIVMVLHLLSHLPKVWMDGDDGLAQLLCTCWRSFCGFCELDSEGGLR